jgi:hypothetical protein
MTSDTRYCPQCGAEYIASVAMCVDCLVPLRDDVEAAGREEPAPARTGPMGEQTGEQTAYDLAEWDPDNRVLLARVLDSEQIPHVWEATDLVIRQEDEQRVEAIMDDIDLDDEEGEQVVYELSDWAPELRATLVERLELARVAYAWDDNGDLVVDENDEDVVEQLLDELEFPDSLDADEDAPPETAAQDVMSDLFVAADRLKKDPADHEGVLGAFDGAQAAAALPTPYGFTDDDWQAIVTRAGLLRDALEGDVDDEQIVELANGLRTLLRTYV